MALSRGSKLGSYEVLSAIGAGGMGEVYRARDLRLGREVAIKVLPGHLVADEGRRRRFLQEAQSASALNHPHIVTIHEIESEGDVDFMVMEYVRGKSLEALIPRHGLRLTELLRIALPVADAVAAAHARGIIHRDLKPANVMVDETGVVKVLDFGLAKLATVDESSSPDTRTVTEHAIAGLSTPGTIVGTAAYMSPEQATGGKVDARSDIFSFGAMLYEIATGVRAFSGQSTAETLAAVIRAQPKPPTAIVSGLPHDLERLILRCLRPEPERRYQTMVDVKNGLQEIKEESESAGVAPAVSQPARRKWVKVALSIAIAALIAGTAWWFRDAVGKWPSTSHPTRTVAAPTLTRLTFQDGLQTQPTWSPDGRFIAYAADRDGNWDIWVQPVSGGDAVQVTKDPARDSAPAWSPDGSLIAFRSERNGGGIYVVQALGGQERRLSSVGQRPRWSPDGTRLLCASETGQQVEWAEKHAYVLTLDGGAPQEALPSFFKELVKSPSVAWHPDGERISIWGEHKTLGPGFWTARLTDAAPVLSEGSVEPIKAGYWFWWYADFVWAPAGDALYFTSQVPESSGVVNAFRVDVDPKTLRWTGKPVRLTNGAGPDRAVAVSPDGRRLAFSGQHEENRIWSFALDAKGFMDHAAGRPLTPPGVIPIIFRVSPDASKMLLVSDYAGTAANVPPVLRELDLTTGTERILSRTIGPSQALPVVSPWSPDGGRVAFVRFAERDAEGRPKEPVVPALVLLDTKTGEERVVPQLGDKTVFDVWDFLPDGQSIVVGAKEKPTAPGTLAIYPLDMRPGSRVRPIGGTPPGLNAVDARVSPNGRWLAVAVKPKSLESSSVYVGDLSKMIFVQVTDGAAYDDGPGWSADGTALYFLSTRGSAVKDVNIWAVRFDPAHGRAVGSPFQVSRFRLGYPPDFQTAGNRLFTRRFESSGHIWMMDNPR